MINSNLLKDYSSRAFELIDRAPATDRDAAFFRGSEFLQRALSDASRYAIHEPRSDDGLTRWMMEDSGRDDMVLFDAVASFLIILRGWELPAAMCD